MLRQEAEFARGWTSQDRRAGRRDGRVRRWGASLAEVGAGSPHFSTFAATRDAAVAAEEKRLGRKLSNNERAAVVRETRTPGSVGGTAGAAGTVGGAGLLIAFGSATSSP